MQNFTSSEMRLVTGFRGIFSSLAPPPIWKYALHRKKERSLSNVVHEATEEKTHCTSSRTFPQVSWTRHKPRNPSLHCFSDQVKVCIGIYCSKTTLTGESRFHISPPRGFEPVILVAGSKQVSPLDQWDMVRIMWDCRLSTLSCIPILWF